MAAASTGVIYEAALRRHPVWKASSVECIQCVRQFGGSVEVWKAIRRHPGVIKTAKCLCYINQGVIHKAI